MQIFAIFLSKFTHNFLQCNKTHKIVKETVEKEFCKSNRTIRVLFYSIAFGMGVNIKDAFLDLNLGTAADLDDFLQETGRIGRGSTQLSRAVLLKYKRCTSSKNITLAMRNYVNNDTNCSRDMFLI
jgi:superfamily II DNA helicase RecQ